MCTRIWWVRPVSEQTRTRSADIIGTFFYRLGIAGEHPVAIPNPGLGATLATVIFIMLTIFVVPTLIKTQREA